jgi:hypothetical protein
MLFLLASGAAIAMADTRENPPSRPRPATTRAPSGGGEGGVAVPRSPGNTSTPSSRHDPPSSGGGRGAGKGHSRHHYPPHYGYGYGYGHYGYHGYGYHWPYLRFYRPYWSTPYYPWGMAWYPAYSTDATIGGLDLSVKPKKADVYVDGEYIGRAGQYDGWPGNLWLESGRHELVFYYEGRETVVRNVRVRPGPVQRLRVDMEKGESTPAEDLFANSVRVAEVDERSPRETPSKRPEVDESRAGAPREATVDLRDEPGRFSLEVVPVDAAVYLDGRFLGSAEELARLHAGMMVDAGDHLLEVQRPGYETQRVEFSVAAGDQKDLRIDLESQSDG